jgi:hypothetical protein
MTDADRARWQAVYGKVIARAWTDSSFKARLLADPRAALAEAGLSLPAGIKVQVLEDTATLTHLVIRQRPSGALSDEDLRRVAGGLPAIQVHSV